MDEFVKIENNTYVLDGYWHVEFRRKDDVNSFTKALFEKMDARTEELVAEGKKCDELNAILQKEMLVWGKHHDNLVPPTIEEVRRDYLISKREFEDSDEWKSLKSHLTAEQEKGLKITKVLGLGMGSCENNTYGSAGVQSLRKEAAMLDTFRSFYGLERMSSQDPVYEELDKAFLEGIGSEILEDPAGFQAIDEETFVWDGSGQLSDVIAKGVYPAVLICRDLLKGHRCTYYFDPEDTERVEETLLQFKKEVRADTTSTPKMVESYPSQFPWKCDIFGQGNLVVYTKTAK